MNYEQATEKLNAFIDWAKQYRRDDIGERKPIPSLFMDKCERALSLRRLHSGEGDVYMVDNQGRVVMILDQSGNFNNIWFDTPQEIVRGGIDQKAWDKAWEL